MYREKFEDIKGITRSLKSKDRQNNSKKGRKKGQTDKQRSAKHYQETKYWTPLKTDGSMNDYRDLSVEYASKVGRQIVKIFVFYL